MVNLVHPALELFHDRQKIILDRAANASVGKVVNLGSMLQSGGAQQSTVDRNLAELIDEDQPNDDLASF